MIESATDLCCLKFRQMMSFRQCKASPFWSWPALRPADRSLIERNGFASPLRGMTIMRMLVCGLAAALTIPATVHATETITYTYDARGRVVAVTHSGTVNNGVSTTYTSDNADNRTQVTTTGASH
jgi:hypothetical protein